jgi:hypothetical protein
MTFTTRKARSIVLASLICALGVWGIASLYMVGFQVSRDAARLHTIIASLAASDPAFAGLKVAHSTEPKTWIYGTLDAPPHLALLRTKIAEVFGQREVDRFTRNVELAIPPTSSTAPRENER